MEIKRVATQASAASSATASAVAALSRDKPAGQEGAAEWFTGKVWIEPLFEAPEPARVRCTSVTFEPCARTAWHTHPLGQTLVVTSGLGWAQREGGPVEEIRPGDVVTKIGGKAVANTAELLNVVAALPPGSDAPIAVQRGDKALDVTVKVAQRPVRQAAAR